MAEVVAFAAAISERFARVPARAARLRLGARDYKVMIAISAHANKDGRAWPSMATISEWTGGIDRRDVPRVIAHLESLNLLRVERRPGRHNIYEVLLLHVGLGADTTVGLGADLTDTSNKPPNRYTGAAIAPRVVDEGFDKFWAEYPSRGGHANPRKPAAAKFAALIKAGADPAQIIDAARQYAATAQSIGDRRHVAQAQTWLNQERFADSEYSPVMRVTAQPSEAAGAPRLTPPPLNPEHQRMLDELRKAEGSQ